ncbi:esterase [Ideonella sp. DXS22W]|uniref:Esterase n=1 Tax=Pseudaquabacterium inlustre TaxID=2984192 RepID=A0ABU9CBG5_9BURK
MTTPLMPHTLQWLPADGSAPQQLMVLLHGWGASAADMAPLAQVLRQQFPQCAVLAPEGFEPVDGTGAVQMAGRQWFSLASAQGGMITEAERPARVAAVLPRLAEWLRTAQAATGVGPQATALVGFSQGSICALELVQRHDGAAGRVLAFAGRYAALPDAAPRETTLHFFHGGADGVIPVTHAKAAIERLAALQGDATIDIAEGAGHEIPPALLRCALQRLTSHIPQRTWREALGAAPARAGQPGELDD